MRLTVSIYEGEPSRPDAEPTGKPRAELTTSLTVPAGKAQPVTLEWKPGAFRADFYYLLGQLWDGDKEIDRIESAFLVRNEKAIAKGPALNFRDNYLRLGTRPMFLFGTDDWSYTFYDAPRDAAAMAARHAGAARSGRADLREPPVRHPRARQTARSCCARWMASSSSPRNTSRCISPACSSVPTLPPATPNWRSRPPGAATSPSATPMRPG